MIDLIKNYSSMVRRTKVSAIRELLKYKDMPGLISFAGGFPSSDLFPSEQIKEIGIKVMTDMPETMLQYAGTGGYMPLKEEIIKFMARHGSKLEPENILITTGGQQGIDLPIKIFVDVNDPVFVEIPSYVGALNSLASTGAKFVGIPMDEDGIMTDKLEEEIKRLISIGEHYKLLYTVPDYQNPSGVSISLERRKRLVELSEKYNFIILEDCPYTY